MNSFSIPKKKWVIKYPLLIICRTYLSTPAKEATEEALLLSTNPGPDGMLAPGRRPAPLLYRCKTTIGI